MPLFNSAPPARGSARGRTGLSKRRRLGLGAWLMIWAACGMACSGLGGGGHSSDPIPARPENEFSGARVMDNLERLARSGGSPSTACEPARDVLLQSLHGIGAATESLEIQSEPGADDSVRPIRALLGILPGTSADPILLIAPYTTDCSSSKRNSVEQGSSSFLLELGRVLSRRSRPYSIWLIFVEDDGSEVPTNDSATARPPTPWRESEAVADELERQGILGRVRVAVFFDGLGLPGATALRDSRSHPVYREVFWESARDLGATDIFQPNAAFASSQVGHRAFIERGLRRTVLVATAGGASDADPGSARPRAKIFESVGTVTLDALGRIEARLERIDSVSRSAEPE